MGAKSFHINGNQDTDKNNTYTESVTEKMFVLCVWCEANLQKPMGIFQ
jgi:hypothetical protein